MLIAPASHRYSSCPPPARPLSLARSPARPLLARSPTRPLLACPPVRPPTISRLLCLARPLSRLPVPPLSPARPPILLPLAFLPLLLSAPPACRTLSRPRRAPSSYSPTAAASSRLTWLSIASTERTWREENDSRGKLEEGQRLRRWGKGTRFDEGQGARVEQKILSMTSCTRRA